MKKSIFRPLKTAVFVDLSFFIKRYKVLHPNLNATELADHLKKYVFQSIGNKEDYIYRIFVYDCMPLDKNISLPISKKNLNLGKTEMYLFRTELLSCLKSQPYFAVRLGKIDENSLKWRFKDYKLQKEILMGKKQICDLTDDDFVLDIKQKGVDMRIGLDMATLANKKQVEKITLITADSDFIPAIKYVRKEGIIIQLDPMQTKQIKPELLEHLDILSSIFPQKKDIEKQMH